MRGGQQPPGLSGQLRPGILGGAQGVEPVERGLQPAARLRPGPRPRRGAHSMPADLSFELVHLLGVLDQPRRAQVIEQVIGSWPLWVEQRAAGQREQRPPDGGAGQRGPPLERDGDPVAAKHPLDQRPAALGGAVDDRDLLAGEAGAEQLEHLGGDQLGLGQLAAGLQQRDRLARIDPLRSGLEQAPLEVVQHRARTRRVMLAERRQLDHPLGERAKLLDGFGPHRQGRTPGLVGERDRDLGPHHPSQRLDRVAFQPVQVIEAVEEHRLGPPPARGGAQGVERAPGEKLGVDPGELLQPRGVHPVDLPHVPRISVSSPVLPGPAPHGGREPIGGDQRALELGDQLACGGRKSGRARRLAQDVEARAVQGLLEHPLALQRGESPARIAGPGGDLARQPGEGEDRAEHRPTGGQLTAVVSRVGRSRDDQDRAAGGGGGEGAQHLPGLRRVRGSQDEGQRHRPIVPRGQDGVILRAAGDAVLALRRPDAVPTLRRPDACDAPTAGRRADAPTAGRRADAPTAGRRADAPTAGALTIKPRPAAPARRPRPPRRLPRPPAAWPPRAPTARRTRRATCRRRSAAGQAGPGSSCPSGP